MDKLEIRRRLKAPNNPVVSPISAHLAHMRAENPEGEARLRGAIVDLFTSENGLMFMKILDISILQLSLGPEPNGRALREHNAHRNLVNDLRRIVSDGNR